MANQPYLTDDTGGYIKGSDDVFEGEIRKQVELAIDEADAIIFVTDVEEGITPMDETVASLLRKVISAWANITRFRVRRAAEPAIYSMHSCKHFRNPK